MTTPARSAVIHAHFYQPPREDPWLDEVPREPTAAPFHDWNERIERECYRAVTAARLPGPDGRIARIVNALDMVSFDVGPTLMGWLARGAPETYRRVIQADRASCERLDGHGNAMAAPFHHVILPLAGRRDKRTEVLWGLADFRHRFGREPEGCWLPETAVDDETLDVLAECGVRFTMLAPHQVDAAPADGLPVRCGTAGGREIALIVYDGPLSHDVAFGPLIRDGAAWAAAIASSPRRLVSIATDGETYGHHHRFGEMALASVLDALAAAPGIAVESPAALLARQGPAAAATLRAPSSWSCAHGIERWRADCGCRLDAETWPSQAWRAPLRRALTELQEALHAQFAREGATALRDPWAARDAYGAVVCGAVGVETFLEEWATGDGMLRRRAAELLEMERHALGMMTSCGWFFDDVSGIETLQVLRYAARALELSGPDGPDLEDRLLAVLDAAASNDPAVGTARRLYVERVRPTHPAPARVAAGAVAARAVGAAGPDIVPPAFDVTGGTETLTVRDRRTGTATDVAVAVTRPGPGRVDIDATPGGPMPLDTLPDGARRAVGAALQREVQDLWFTDAEAGALCRGRPIDTVAGHALLRAIVALQSGAGMMDVTQVLDLLDLHALLDLPVPFDAQTAFAEVRPALGHLDPDRVTTLARRLGFA